MQASRKVVDRRQFSRCILNLEESVGSYQKAEEEGEVQERVFQEEEMTRTKAAGIHELTSCIRKLGIKW